MSQDDVARAKADLEAAGQTWTTDCDSHRITNLVARRLGLQLVEKLSGVQCHGRKVDGIVDPHNGVWVDCQINAGPPSNGNVPAWQVMGPASAVVAVDPVPDPVEGPGPAPVPPPADKLDTLIWLGSITYQQTLTNYEAILAIQRALKAEAFLQRSPPDAG